MKAVLWSGVFLMAIGGAAPGAADDRKVVPAYVEQEWLKDARDLRKSNFPAALRLVHKTLQAENVLVAAGGEKVGTHELARRFFDSLSGEELKLHEQLYGSAAEKLLDAAVKADDPVAMHALFRVLGYTKAGLAAGRWAGGYHLDLAEFEIADDVLSRAERIGRKIPATKEETAALLSRLLIARTYAGEADRVKETLKLIADRGVETLVAKRHRLASSEELEKSIDRLLGKWIPRRKEGSFPPFHREDTVWWLVDQQLTGTPLERARAERRLRGMGRENLQKLVDFLSEQKESKARVAARKTESEAVAKAAGAVLTQAPPQLAGALASFATMAAAVKKPAGPDLDEMRREKLVAALDAQASRCETHGGSVVGLHGAGVGHIVVMVKSRHGNQIVVRSRGDMKVRNTFEVRAGPYAIDPSGQYAAVADNTHGKIHVYELATGKLARKLSAPLGGATFLRFSIQSKRPRLIASSGTATLDQYDLQTGYSSEFVGPADANADQIGGVGDDVLVASPTTRRIARKTRRNLIDGTDPIASPKLPGEVRAFRVSPDGKTVAALFQYEGTKKIGDEPSGRVAILDAATMKVRQIVSPGKGSFYQLEFSPDGHELFLGGMRQTTIYDVKRGAVKEQVRSPLQVGLSLPVRGGKEVAFRSDVPSKHNQICFVPRSGDGPFPKIIPDSARGLDPEWKPTATMGGGIQMESHFTPQ